MKTSLLSKNLILGCAFNYTNKDIFPFLVSLEQCSYRDDLVLLTNNGSTISLERYAFKGKIINVDEEFGQEIKKDLLRSGPEAAQEQQLLNRTLQRLEKGQNLSEEMVAFFYRHYFLMTSRYFLYYHYLVQWNYTQILLTDVADVFFQSNPFAQAFKDGVTVFAEHEAISIKEESTNKYWISETFGNEVLQSMGDKIVYCAGTIVLKNIAIEFLKDFLSIILNHAVSRTIKGVDQGVFNYMLSFLKLDYFNRKQNGDVVLTVANVPEHLVSITNKGITLTGTERLPDVVHQYTRFMQQQEFVSQKFQQP